MKIKLQSFFRTFLIGASTLSAVACAKTEYHLPDTKQVDVSSPETQFLKSFSKVFSNIAKEAKPALLLVLAEKKVVYNQPRMDDFFFPFFPPEFGGPRGPQKKEGKETGAGSGFIVDVKNGYAITNNHVIDGADKITVTTFDNRKFDAKLVGTAKNLDVAVLKIQNLKETKDLKALNLSNSDDVEVGDWAVALGAPFELPQTLTMGVVSAVKRSSDVLGIHGPNNFIQTDASINPGNSGGPLLNIYGQVMGMNTAIYSRTGTSVGIGFAIPSNTIRLVADSIISTGKLTQSYLGVEMYDVSKFSASVLKEMKITPRTEGGFVMRVLPDSPAAQAGLQPYDIIYSINGVDVKTMSEIQSQIMFLKPGSTAKLGVIRDNKKITLNAVVREMPDQEVKQKEDNANDTHDQNGKSLATKYGLKLSGQKRPTGGVGIVAIYNNSLAEMAGLQSGDVLLEVNRTKVSTKEEVEHSLEVAEKANQGTLFLLIERDGHKVAVMLQTGG